MGVSLENYRVRIGLHFNISKFYSRSNSGPSIRNDSFLMFLYIHLLTVPGQISGECLHSDFKKSKTTLGFSVTGRIPIFFLSSYLQVPNDPLVLFCENKCSVPHSLWKQKTTNIQICFLELQTRNPNRSSCGLCKII